MKTIIGLLPRTKDLEAEIQVMKNAGIKEGQVKSLAQEKDIFQALKCEPACIVTKYMAWGAFLVGAFYTVAAVLAGWCECNVFGYETKIALETLIAGILVGGFIGAVLGLFVGLAQTEADTHLYIQGARIGGQVIVVETDPGDIEHAIQILKQQGLLGVRAL
jgi:shikimate kinase